MDSLSEKNPAALMLFFSGLAADTNLFAPQKLYFANLVTPEWLEPVDGESLQDYSARWLSELRAQGLEIDKNTVVGGASFGGLIAQQMAQQLGTKHCFLFGSIKCQHEIPWRIRWLKPIHKLAFRWIIRFWQIVIGLMLKLIGSWLPWRSRTVFRQFCGSDAKLVKWSIRQFFAHTAQLNIESQTNVCTFTIYQIHGELDPVFPFRNLSARDDTRIYKLRKTGHLLTLSNPKKVNQIIEDIVGENPKPDAHPDLITQI